MDIIRIGDKVVNKELIYRTVDRILELRAQGLSQQDVAAQLGVDRTLVSRLEGLGEIRKGERVALIGFPVANKKELEDLAAEEGVDFVFLMNNNERWDWVKKQSGADLIGEVMQLISLAKDCDRVIFIGSDMRIKMAEALLGRQVIGIEIGTSPIRRDVYVEPERIREYIRGYREKE